MKRKTKILLILSLITLISISCFSIIALKAKGENHQQANLNKGENNPEVALLNDVKKEQQDNNAKIVKTKQHEELINISECSEEFIEEYFEEVKEIEDKENVLIVSSKEKIENTHGAVNVIKAPNNQYILQYNSEEEKNKALENLKENKEILYVDENHTYTLYESDYNSWGIEAMGLDSAIETTEDASEGSIKDVTVAIIDSGCDMELFDASYKGKINETYNLYDPYEMYDTHGHGTHIAGTIAEGTSSNVKILPIKVSNSRTMSTLTILNAVNYVAYYKKADVINMSFGSTYFDNSLYVAIEAALDNGIISVAAAGNESTSQNSYPAAYDNTISVSAVDSEFKLAQFSNYGNMITFAAPGVGIQSINGSMNGTSMATPHVVCAVAMLKGVNKSLSLEQTVGFLKNTAIDLGTAGWDKYFGYGLIDLSNFDDLIEKTQNTNIVDFEIRDTQFEAIYGNITNLMGLKIILKDASGNEYIKYLSELENLEIENYNAFVAGEQQIKIKYNNIEKTITVNNGSSGGSTSAYSGYYTDENKTAVLIGNVRMVESIKKIYIPENIGELKVVGIYNQVFEGEDINEIILPKTITSIGDAAFANSTIRTVTGGASEVSLGANVFYNAYKLEIFEPKISTLGEGTFYNASSINTLKLSDNIEKINRYAFANCTNLENINIPNNLKEIEEQAFFNTKIKKLAIPKSLVTISETALIAIAGLEEISVDSKNTVYDSRENCNALIKTNTNTIVLGSANTIIPDSITTIGAYAFYNNNKIKTIHTNKVDTIGDYAFQYCANLEGIYLGDNIETVGRDSLCDIPKLTLYAYNNALLWRFQGLYGINEAVCIIPGEDKVEVIIPEKYRFFDKADDIQININYYGWTKKDDGLQEKITEGYKITYQNGGDCFKKGDTYFIVSATTKHGIKIEKTVNVVLEKAIPEYTLPTNITAKIGQKLSEISLPTGFKWMNENLTITEGGEQVYYAKFTPTDTSTYEIVENIEIIVHVGAIKPQTIKLDKTNLVFNILEKQKLTATIIPENTTNKNVTWKSTNTNVARVNENGEVQPIKDGTCEIICTSEADSKVQARCTIVVDNTLQTTIRKTYNEDNTVTVSVESKYEFEDTKPSWDLSGDKKTYTKTYNTNGTYSTAFKDIYHEAKTLTFTINEIKSKYIVSKTYDVNTNTVTVNVINNRGMQATKPTWMLSADGKVYTKTYNANGIYTTTFTDAQGVATLLTFTINEIDDKGPELELNITYFDDLNWVNVTVTSNEVLGETKPTWTLSEDKKQYSKTYKSNGTYSTKFEDKYGNVKEMTFTVKGIISKYDVSKTYDASSNSVMITVINNYGMKDTKPTWNLIDGNRWYFKNYKVNGTYTTTFVDADGIETQLTFTINEIDDVAPNLTTRIIYNDYNNTVTVEVTADEEFGKTKPTWNLSEDKKTYSKEYNKNGIYTTKFEDKYGNTKELTFTVNKIISKYEIRKVYYPSINRVTVFVINNYGFTATKPTWTLIESENWYYKEYSKNGTYTTKFVDADGIETNLTFTIDEIK